MVKNIWEGFCMEKKNSIINSEINIESLCQNSIELIQHGSLHQILIDGTVFGMGKNAGNAPLELLMKYYRKEHNVEYYAYKLHLSAHYLTLIVKKVTGRTPSDFIYEMLYGEAKSLLSQSNLSIQEVASQLNFSD